jgi:tetratricopeptide (TPR) repeat protein
MSRLASSLRTDAPRPPSRVTSQDTSAQRLSRTVPKHASRARPDTPESYAVEFFKENPLDKREPREKLEEIESKLSEDLDENERFHLLIQLKTLRYLTFGENSVESVDAMRQIGEFYNSQHRPEGALRHLVRAQELAQGVDLPDTERLTLAVALADALLSVTPTTRQEEHKNLSAADMALNPMATFEPEDQLLGYRRDLMSARLKGRKGRLTEAMIQYEKAAKTLDVLNEGEVTEMTAELFREMARTAEQGGDPAAALRLYRRAHSIFRELGLLDAAEAIEPKLQQELVTDSEDDSMEPAPVVRHPPPRQKRRFPSDVQDDSSSVFDVPDDEEEETQ